MEKANNKLRLHQNHQLQPSTKDAPVLENHKETGLNVNAEKPAGSVEEGHAQVVVEVVINAHNQTLANSQLLSATPKPTPLEVSSALAPMPNNKP